LDHIVISIVNVTYTIAFYTLSLHDALPISAGHQPAVRRDREALPRRHRPSQAGPLVRRLRTGLHLPVPAPGFHLGQGPRRPRPDAAAAQAGRRGAARRISAEHVL